MKNKLNLFLLISFLIAFFLTVWVYYQVTNEIGDIEYDKNIDNSGFKVCNEDRIFQYYSVETNYHGGEKAIKKEFSTLIDSLIFEKSGYITYRFIINCNGELGRFRIKTVDPELIENSFDQQKIKVIQESIEKLRNWKKGKWKNERIDSYYLLNFKIMNHKIIDIF